MANNADNVRVAVTGGLYYDNTGELTPPTGTADDLTDWPDLGYISDEGITLNMPGEGDKTPIKAWQNGDVVRVMRTPPEDQPTMELTCIETSLGAIEFAFGVEVEQSTNEGMYVINTNQERKHIPLVLDVIDGPELIRYFAPKAIVTGIGATNLVNTGAIGYQLTIALDFDSGINGQIKTWATALRADEPTG